MILHKLLTIEGKPERGQAVYVNPLKIIKVEIDPFDDSSYILLDSGSSINVFESFDSILIEIGVKN